VWGAQVSQNSQPEQPAAKRRRGVRVASSGRAPSGGGREG
jgi:hypothetical protein